MVQDVPATVQWLPCHEPVGACSGRRSSRILWHCVQLLKALFGKKCRTALHRLDFVRGFHGSHVRDYVRAAEPSFVVGEYWDSLSYDSGLPDHNQVCSFSCMTSFNNCLEVFACSNSCAASCYACRKPYQTLLCSRMITINVDCSRIGLGNPAGDSASVPLLPWHVHQCIHPGTAPMHVLPGLRPLRRCRTLTGSA